MVDSSFARGPGSDSIGSALKTAFRVRESAWYVILSYLLLLVPTRPVVKEIP
jgi:hypothetical protein